MLTEVKAKKLAIKLWAYLHDHPYIREERYVSWGLHKKIRHLINGNPLCSIFYERGCKRCPLFTNGKASCLNEGNLYCDWLMATDSIQRRQAAAKIVELIEKWEV